MSDTNGLPAALKEVFGWGAQAARPIEAGDATLFVHPNDWKVTEITDQMERVQPAPFRAKGTQVVQALESFVALTKDLGNGGNGGVRRTYLDLDAKRFRTVFNDHGVDGSDPGWRDHILQYTPKLSVEATAWMKSDRRQMEQTEFAEFIEDRIADIGEGTTLLIVATTLQAKTEVNFSSSKRLDNGQTQLVYNESIGASAGDGSVTIPREFSLGIPLFERGDRYLVTCRLKYRLGGGKVKFWYEIDRADRLFSDALDQMTAKVVEAGITVYHGA